MLKVAYPRELAEVGAQFVGEGQWRLVNKSVDRADPAGLLGFVQRIGGSYEVLELERPADARRVMSLREARALLVGPREGHE
ncbi:hypothetical protein [Naasia sp. SYSU D00057]|uniref:hypothetical protein n=1 Tax=Naasia sp. SYSU D00057 TaxID=2817380 RepID=UPI001B30EA3E|nr:hypothetical protein [Naasia sp. SYSU D00057]